MHGCPGQGEQHRKGRLEVGYDADVSVFAPDEGFTVAVAGLQHKNPVSVHTGRDLRWVVRVAYLRGELVDGRTPRGKLLERGIWSKLPGQLPRYVE